MSESQDKSNEEAEESRTRRFLSKFFKYAIAIIIIVSILVYILPTYNFHFPENPRNIPTIHDKFISEIRVALMKQLSQLDAKGGINKSYKVNRSYSNLQTLVRYKTTEYSAIKQIAAYVATKSCPHYDKLCYAKALFYFVRDNFRYINDPYDKDYFATPIETIVTDAGDCDDFSSLLANMLYEVGIDSRYVLIPRHIFVEAYFPDSPKFYQLRKDGYIALDPTCQFCKFGSIPVGNVDDNFIYLG
ncbi:MAG: hypothetical protein GWP09_02115 [Nitrospiraceae bacterium]|nr:hypothetical protein [Nitrospiraceae bacterium]